jgi:hypothetical protein
VTCSGLRWLRGDGDLCRPNDVIAYCSIGLVPAAGSPIAARGSEPFATEALDFQVAFAPRVGGRLRRSAASTRGGLLDQLPYFQRWSPDFVIGHLEPDGDVPSSDAVAACELRLLIGCRRRVTGLADVRTGFLTGWHDRSRAWWADGDGPLGTLLSTGICELAGIVRGEQGAFHEIFTAVRGPAPVVFVPDETLVPSARLLAEQFVRKPGDAQAIAVDFARALANGAIPATGSDWMFAGAVMTALGRSPLSDRYDVLLRGALRRDVAVDAVVLSLHSETGMMLRHRRLGYVLKCHRFRFDEAGPGVRAWLKASFEPLERTPDEIRRDYVALIDAVRARSPVRVLVLNCMSTSGTEVIASYVPFERPMRRTLTTIRSKELNLMLHDVARERDIAIVDTDAIAAELGGGAHLPDGVHASGLLEAEVRAEILRILDARGVPGF